MNPLELPKLTKHVTDFSWVLTSAQIESFSKQLAEHETRTTEQVTVVLFPHREWHELLDIWLKIFNENGIGQKNLNNWLLLIIATDEKKIRIITGKWMEIKYSEMRCRDIIENHLRPLLNEGKYDELIWEWIKYITEDATKPHKSWGKDIQKTENTVSDAILKTNKVQKIFWQVMFWTLILLFLGIFIWDEQSKFLYICLLFGIPFFIWGIFWVFRWKEAKIQKILLRIVFIALGWLFLSWSYLQIYCHTQYINLIPNNETICKVFPIIMKNTWSGKNWSYKSSPSSSSSFGGWGGSSNGGGYGD